MANLNRKTLVIGAAGHFAGLVVPALAAHGITVRGLVRDNDQGDKARENGATEIAVGDLRDRASLDAALRGVDNAFYIAPVFQNDEAAMGLAFVEVAKSAGVRRIVFSSVIHPVISQLQNHIQKAPVEAAIFESGMEFAILHPAVFYQNMVAAWPMIVKTGVVAEPFSKAARISGVDYRDVAEVAAMVLAGDRLLNGTFELCADAGLTRDEVAGVISQVLGRPIKAAAPEFDTWMSDTQLPHNEQQTQELATMYAYYDRYGLLGNALTLQAILGRAPRSLHQFVTDLASGIKTIAE